MVTTRDKDPTMKLIHLAAKKPHQIFWWFIALHLTLWTLLPCWSSPNAPIDVIEGYAWGREWLMGTYKHPPMQAWWLEVFAWATGRAAWAHFLASQVAVVIAFWAVWQTGRRIVGATQALIGALLLEGVIYYNFTSVEFNPNVLQLMFWALAGWSFHRAVKDNRLTDWLLLGVWGAGGLYSKYSTALLLATFVVLMILRPEARRRLKNVGPYLALAVTFLLFLPHLVWLTQHDFMPFTYVKERLHSAEPATHYFTPPAFFPLVLLSPIVFVVGQLLALLPASLLFLVLLNVQPERRATGRINKFDRTFLAAVTFAPTILTLLMAVGFGFKTHDMWGAPFFNFAGLWALVRFYPAGAGIDRRFVIAWGIVFCAGLLGLAGGNVLAPHINHKPLRVHFAGAALAQAVTAEWHKRYNVPLDYVIGDVWVAGNIAYYAPERPHVFLDANPAISPWINPDDVRHKGAVIVWCLDHCGHRGDLNPDHLPELFPRLELQKPLTLPQQTSADTPAAVIGWAILPPE